MALNIHCYNCGNGWKVRNHEYEAIGAYEYLQNRRGVAAGKDINPETVCKFEVGASAQPINCPKCGMQGPHEIEG